MPPGQASFDEVQNEINNQHGGADGAAQAARIPDQLRAECFSADQGRVIVDSGAAPGKDTAGKIRPTLKPQTTTKEAVANQRHLKKFLKVVPYGQLTGVKDTGAAAPPEVAPVPDDAGEKRGWLEPAMKSPFVRELKPNEIATAVFLVHSKEIRQKRTGEPYLSLMLADRSGEIDAKMWDNVAEVMDTFDRDDFVKVKGLLQLYNNRPQFTIHKLRPVAGP